MTRLDPERLRLRTSPRILSPQRLIRSRRTEHFLKGPVPLPWLEAAAKLPGRSLHSGIAIWYAASLTRSQSVPLGNVAGDRFGLDRNAKYRALAWLERAVLVRVERKLGRSPVVTILTLEARS